MPIPPFPSKFLQPTPYSGSMYSQPTGGSPLSSNPYIRQFILQNYQRKQQERQQLLAEQRAKALQQQEIDEQVVNLPLEYQAMARANPNLIPRISQYLFERETPEFKLGKQREEEEFKLGQETGKARLEDLLKPKEDKDKIRREEEQTQTQNNLDKLFQMMHDDERIPEDIMRQAYRYKETMSPAQALINIQNLYNETLKPKKEPALTPYQEETIEERAMTREEKKIKEAEKKEKEKLEIQESEKALQGISDTIKNLPAGTLTPQDELWIKSLIDNAVSKKEALKNVKNYIEKVLNRKPKEDDDEPKRRQ